MSMGQASINTSWLDEELRKKSALIEDLRDVIDKQQLSIADQAQRIAGLESRLAKMQAQIGQITEVQEAVQHTGMSSSCRSPTSGRTPRSARRNWRAAARPSASATCAP